MRVIWSPLRPGLSPDVPNCAPRCSRTFCSHSLSLVSQPLFFLSNFFANIRWAPTTTELSVLLTQNSVIQLAHKIRRRCHLCMFSVADSKITGCPDLLCHLLLSKALCGTGRQNSFLLVHKKYCNHCSGSLRLSG